MNQALGLVSLVVREYDEAIAFYVVKPWLHSCRGHIRSGAEQALGRCRAVRFNGIAPSAGTSGQPRAGGTVLAIKRAGAYSCFSIRTASNVTIELTRPKVSDLFASRRKNHTEELPCLKTFTVTCGPPRTEVIETECRRLTHRSTRTSRMRGLRPGSGPPVSLFR